MLICMGVCMVGEGGGGVIVYFIGKGIFVIIMTYFFCGRI